MGYVADKALGQLLELFQIACHVIKRGGKLVDLVAVVVLGDAHAEITGCKFLGCVCHGFERTGHTAGQEVGDDQRTDQRNDDNNEENLGDFLQNTDHTLAARSDEHQREILACAVFTQRADNVVLFREHRAERAHRGIHGVARERIDDLFGDGTAVAVAAGVGVDAQQDIARQVGQDDAHLVLLGGGAQRGVEHGDIEAVAGLYCQTGQLGDRLRGRRQLGLFFRLGIAIHLIEECAAGQSKGYQNQNDRGDEIFCKKASFQLGFPLVCGQFLVSNL